LLLVGVPQLLMVIKCLNAKEKKSLSRKLNKSLNAIGSFFLYISILIRVNAIINFFSLMITLAIMLVNEMAFHGQ
jgi:hypothetical protein